MDETFIVHAGDTYIVSNDLSHVKIALEVHERSSASATLLVTEVDDPRPYGVVGGESLGTDIWKVTRVEEKPEKPWSRLAILPLYVFEPEIFEVLAETPPGKGGEVQLTDGIGGLIRRGRRVIAVKLPEGTQRLDIGSPKTLWEAINISHKIACKSMF